MFIAPPLAPAAKRRGVLFRFVSALGLLLATIALIIANVVLMYAVYYTVNPNVSPQQLYHRVWQLTKDNAYYRDRLGDWDKWEHKYDREIHSDADAIRFAGEMIKELHDPYSYVMDPRKVEADKQEADGKFVGLGIVLADKPENGGYTVIKQVIPGGPAEKAGIAAGDRLVKIDGQSVVGLGVNEIAVKLKGESGTPATVELERAGQALTITVVRAEVKVGLVTTRRLSRHLADGICYLRLQSFEQWDTADQVEQGLKQLSDCRALIIDVRDNPGGFIHEAVLTSSLFLDQGTVLTESQRLPENGYVSVTTRLSPHALNFELSSGPFSGLSLWAPIRLPNLSGKRPVALLINGDTASAAEIFTAALKENGRATVIGTQTFGKGVGQTYVPVGNGALLRITSLRVTTPKGNWVGDGRVNVANGIVPDIVVEAVGSFDSGEDGDNQLQAAIDFLSRKP